MARRERDGTILAIRSPDEFSGEIIVTAGWPGGRALVGAASGRVFGFAMFGGLTATLTAGRRFRLLP
ncbi:hypothetical protein [Methylobacterium marchantiae]|uniref:Uncharacterized protein n=1 Tax=Methylobacterium marchantiae TaxID=600331 RepID=A0ABW3WUN1_9HYPH